MLLAFVHHRKGSSGEIEEAMLVASNYEAFSRLMHGLPRHDRSLDLVVHRNIARIRSGNCDLLLPEPFEFKPYMPDKSVADINFANHVLLRKPGPFEVRPNGTMGNPCIRSCFAWCADQLELVQGLPINTKTSELCGNSKAALSWAESNAFFRAMWERWRILPGPVAIWMNETQALMGISPSELLLLVCRAVHQANLDD